MLQAAYVTWLHTHNGPQGAERRPLGFSSTLQTDDDPLPFYSGSSGNSFPKPTALLPCEKGQRLRTNLPKGDQ